ncbi:MAG: spore coat associated protein CotJA [Acidobacteriota bacterium]
MKGNDNMELARAYFKIQQYTKRFPPAEALLKGTIFPELYQPYDPRDQRKESVGILKRGIGRG